MDGHFKQPPEMDFSHEDNLSEKWKRWKQTMNLYLEVAMGEKTEKEQCRAVLYVIGLEGREIYNTFNFGENEADKLKVKERLLREDGLTLDKAVGICRADEESRKQMKTLNEEEQVHALRRKTQNQRTNRNEGYAKKGPSRRDHEKRESNSSFGCGKCGTTHERRNCPAYGVETDIDDILVWGTTRKEHDDRLRSVLNRCQEVGLTLNAENASFESKRFNDYTYGKHINVESDHKPLEMIVRKSLGCAPPRLQRMLLRLKIRFLTEVCTRKDLIVPDMLSRAPIKINTNNEVENDIECFVNMVIRNTSMSDRNLEQTMEETSKDDTLQTLTRLIIDGWPDEKNEVPKEVFEYWNFRDELSNVNGIILKGEKIIIPASMRKNMLNKLHEGHLGIEKTRKLARDSIFWPGISAQITDFISKCSVCLESRRSNTKRANGRKVKLQNYRG
ncbi:unnamed protein product [Mytilus coruscus]|uniref:Integrase zinc-binding domain-containing protein n=1 Tax=Mytilus coruscus TaxID=42192 RepID=A0A6J8CMT9_MYTCO|nr:unnamed protein product [Mytilus coruscus]